MYRFLGAARIEEDEESCSQREFDFSPYLNVGEDIFARIDVPESLEFDVRNHWPLQGALDIFVDMVLRKLPNNRTELIRLYQGLRSHLVTEDRQKYKVKIILNLIEWVYLERIYSDLRKQEGFSDTVDSAIFQKPEEETRT